ncbi:MAG: IS701 family transposase [Streptosporangiaceae bacterium]
MLAVVDEAQVLAGAGHAVWSESFNELFARVAGVFGNAAVRRHGRAYLLGLLSHTERKNSWMLAEFAGDLTPDGMQRLLNFSPWDEDACRDALGRYVIRHLGDPGGVVVADETGFLKKGRMSAGVARMYTGTAGRVENCQVGVFLAYAAPDGGRALIDRELYLPQKWAEDRDRCRAAGISDDVAFATKPRLAQDMLGRAVAAGVPFSWFAADEVYGQNPGLRAWLENERIGYVMAIPCSGLITAAAGPRRADELAALVPAGAWQRLSCGDGSKGPRLYDWALVDAVSPDHWLLVRRSLQPGEKGELELAYFLCYSPGPVTLPELVAVAGARWAVEDCFAEAKNEAGLDHYQVRKYRAWYRHITLSMLAHAFLAVTARAARPRPPGLESACLDAGRQPGKKGS